MFWRKKKRPPCDAHDFEILTRVSESISTCGGMVDSDYYAVTRATCVKCGYTRELDRKEIRSDLHGRLLAVHRDPLGMFSEIAPNKTEVTGQ